MSTARPRWRLGATDAAPGLEREQAQGTRKAGPWRTGLLAAAAWAGLGMLTLLWPNKEIGFSEWAFTQEFGIAALVVALCCWPRPRCLCDPYGQHSASTAGCARPVPGWWPRRCCWRCGRR